MKKQKNIVILMMGGKATRFNQNIPKQYVSIKGLPLYLYIVRKFNSMKNIDSIVIVTNPDYYEKTLEWNELVDSSKVSHVICGGQGRSRDVLSALNTVSEFAEPEDVVLIHDATHPYVDVEGTNKVIDAICEYGGATLGGKQYDTVSGASPEGFKFGLIYDIYKNSTWEELDKMTSAGALALAKNIKMAIIPSDILNLKITFPGDMEIFSNLVDSYFFKEDE